MIVKILLALAGIVVLILLVGLVLSCFSCDHEADRFRDY